MQGLTKQVVGSYKAIEAKMEEGTSNRTVAATAMNATSSRAHTLVTIQFDQVFSRSFLSYMLQTSRTGQFLLQLI